MISMYVSSDDNTKFRAGNHVDCTHKILHIYKDNRYNAAKDEKCS